MQCKFFQFREKSFSILHMYFILLSVVLSVRGVISYKSFEADTSRNTSSTDRQNWLYSKQLRDGARMEIHSQQQIAQTEKYLDRNPQSCHISRHLWRSRQTLKKKKSDFSSGLKTVLILAKKDREELLQKYVIFTVKPRNERILQSKKKSQKCSNLYFV